MIFIYFKYQEEKVYYSYYQRESANIPIICLHGWGSSGKTFNDLLADFKNDIYLLDLPGFGKSLEPCKVYTLDDYVYLLRAFICQLKLKKVILIAHSFGGRIAIRYLNLFNGRSNIEKIVLIASAGLKRKKKLVKNLKILQYKFKKKWYKLTKNYLEYNYLVKNSGSSDYQNASIMMKKIMKNVLKKDLKKDLAFISCKTLLIWGTFDQQTPLEQGLLMHKLIKNSELITFDKASHFVYLEESTQVKEIIRKFIGE